MRCHVVIDVMWVTSDAAAFPSTWSTYYTWLLLLWPICLDHPLVAHPKAVETENTSIYTHSWDIIQRINKTNNSIYYYNTTKCSFMRQYFDKHSAIASKKIEKNGNWGMRISLYIQIKLVVCTCAPFSYKWGIGRNEKCVMHRAKYRMRIPNHNT